MSEAMTRDRFRLIEAVRKGEETFDLEAYHAMDARDNAMVEQELLHGAGSKAFVYNFEVQGKAVVGVSVVGARHLAATYGGIKHQLIGSMQKTGSLFTFTSYPQPGIPMNMQCAVLPELAEEPDFYAAVVQVEDIKQGNTIQVERRELRWERRRDGTKYERPMYATIAQSKAYRNGVLALVAQDVLLNWKEKMLALGNTEGVTADAIAEKRAGILRYAAANSIAVDRRAIEGLTYDQIAGLSDAVKADKADGFRAAAEALGILARLGVVQEQPTRTATMTASAPRPAAPATPAAQAQPTQAASGPEAPAAFSAVLMGADGEPADGEVYTSPVGFANGLSALVSDFPAANLAIMEHNADGIADASKASVIAAQIIESVRMASERAVAETISQAIKTMELPVDVPIVRGKPSWSGWLNNLKETLPSIHFDQFLPFLETNRENMQAAIYAIRLQALRAVHARAGKLGIALPVWAPKLAQDEPAPASDTGASNEGEKPEAADRGLGAEVSKNGLPVVDAVAERASTQAADEAFKSGERWTTEQIEAMHAANQAGLQNSSPEAKSSLNALAGNFSPAPVKAPDRDELWEQDIYEALKGLTSIGEVDMFGKFKSTQVTMARLKIEKPDMFARVFAAFDARKDELKASNGGTTDGK